MATIYKKVGFSSLIPVKPLPLSRKGRGVRASLGCHSHESGNPVKQCNITLDSRLRGNDKTRGGSEEVEGKNDNLWLVFLYL